MDEKSFNNRYLIIHGHFYQPPREDPWTGVIEHQGSAYPYHDWNERIHDECYKANSETRFLTSNGQINKIINNYNYISFNFGPTLMDWIRKNYQSTYKAIISADEFSKTTCNNHGNAIAQVYNHVILTLCNDKDIKTQIQWGISDFQFHFNRYPEGMWLSETAINMRVVEYLIDYGMKYVILSPYQADKVRLKSSQSLINKDNGDIDVSKPYILNAKNGKIAVFFYHKELSTAISFEHLLTSAQSFHRRILSSFPQNDKTPSVISIATDGEVYGHHEAFADMCLGALIENNIQQAYYKMTNFGHYLEMFPPEDEVTLKLGNDGLGTAWSCSHGVGRWYSDCGCSTSGQNGWNQRWRTPLRSAFDYLRDQLIELMNIEGVKYFKEPWLARDGYISCLLDNSEESRNKYKQTFFKDELSIEDENVAWKLLEIQKNAMFMYTSCGWFFSELSGIETVQCMRYASRSLNLAEGMLNENVETRFEGILANAFSNITEYQNGRWIYQNFVKKYIFSMEKIINQFILDRIFTKSVNHSIYHYMIDEIESNKIEKGSLSIFCGKIKAHDTLLKSNYKYLYFILLENKIKVHTYIRPYNDEKLFEYLNNLVKEGNSKDIRINFKDWFLSSFSLTDLTYDYKEIILDAIFHNMFLDIHSDKQFELEEYLQLIECFSELNVVIPIVVKSALETVFNNILFVESQHLQQNYSIFDFNKVTRICYAGQKLQLDLIYDTVGKALSIALNERLSKLKENLHSKVISEIYQLLDFANKTQIKFRRKDAENFAFYLLQNKVIPLIDQYYSKPDELLYIHINDLIILSDKLNISTIQARNKLLNLTKNESSM